MQLEIGRIRISKRIRKLTPRVEELAEDIKKNGLINPITVMAVDSGGYQLLAGLRRLRAVQSLGLIEIEVSVVAPQDAEAALNIEYSENTQRESFTYSEKMDYARLIAEIEKAKAAHRKSIGGQGGFSEDTDQGPYLKRGETRTIVGEKIGMSGKQYDRAKYIANHAPQEVIDELDRGERTIRATYDELRSADDKPDAEHTQPESDLERAIRSEQELAAMQYRWHNEIFHRDSTIENLKSRINELENAIAKANARIAELEIVNGI